MADVHSKSVLVVDDDVALRTYLERLLAKKGLALETAGDGLSALDALQRKQYDLVLLDLGLPRLSGMELLRHTDSFRGKPKIIVMTGDSTPEKILHALRGRVCHYLSKPFDPEEVDDAVEFALAIAECPTIEVVSAGSDWLELLIPCQLDCVERVHGFVTRLIHEFPKEERDSMMQGVRELLLNAIEWGGKMDASARVRLVFVRGKRMLMFRIADPGSGFKFDEITHAAINAPADDVAAYTSVREEKGLRPGGLGLMMVRALADELIYNETQNEVLFVKYLPDRTQKSLD